MGYSECYAILNKKRENYLAYMLVQEILFWISIIVFSEVTRSITQYMRDISKPGMKLQWYIILQTLTTAVTALALLTFFIRLKGKYCFREIEDIVIFDKSQR